MSEPVLSLSGVSKTYRVKQGLFGKKLPLAALQDITFALHQGEVVGLVGESGCGKSTVAKILLRLLEPSEGRVTMSGRSLDSVPRREIARLVQPVFQDPYASLNPRKTVAQIVGLPLKLLGVPGDDRDRKVAETLELVGLPRRSLSAYPSQMSGGQRQRVAVARALIARPDVLICDEPTSALDVSIQSQILNLLQDLREQLSLTYLLISHDLSVVRHMADRVVVMYLGKIVEEGPTEAIFESPRHPYTRALLQSVLPPFPGQGLPDIEVGGEFPNPINPPSGCAFHPRCPLVTEACKRGTPALEGAGAHRAACLRSGEGTSTQ